MFKLFLLSVAILLPAILFMAYRLLFTKNGKFPHTHVSGSPALVKKGIYCAQSQDKLAQKKKTTT